MPDPGPGQTAGIVQQSGRVVAVGAAHEQHDTGPGAAQQPDVRGLQWPGMHVDDVCAGRHGHPVPRLGRRQPVGAHHGETQPAAGRGAGKKLRFLTPAGRRHRAHGGVHAREDVAGGGPVLRKTRERSVGMDQHRLGPRRTHVEADRCGLVGGRHGARA